MATKLIRVTGKIRRGSHPFVAGFESDGHVIRAAPLLKYMIGWSDEQVRKALKKNNWKATIIVGESSYKVSDELIEAPTPTAKIKSKPLPAAHVAIEHNCAVCGEFGSFGYGVHLLRGEPGQWFCGEHRPDKNETRMAA